MLEFQPGSYLQAYTQGQENEYQNRQGPLDALSTLSDSLLNLEKSNQQKKLYELQLAEAQRKQSEADLDDKPIGELLSSRSISGPVSMMPEPMEQPGMGEAALPQQRGGMVAKFRDYLNNNRLQVRGGSMMPEAPTPEAPTSLSLDALLSPENIPKLSLKQLKMASEAKKYASAGMEDYYTPEQATGIMKGDFTPFGGRIPKAAVNQSTLVNSREANLGFRKGQEEERLDEKAKGRYRNYLLDMEQRDPIIKEMNKQGIALGQVDQLLAMVRSGNTVAAGALGAKMARAMGEVGVFTDQDVTRYVQSGALGQGAADKLSKMIRGIPTDATLEEMQQIATTIQDSFQSKIQPRYDNYINSYAQIEGIPPEEFAKKLVIPYGKSNRTVKDQKKVGRFIVEEE